MYVTYLLSFISILVLIYIILLEYNKIIQNENENENDNDNDNDNENENNDESNNIIKVNKPIVYNVDYSYGSGYGNRGIPYDYRRRLYDYRSNPYYNHRLYNPHFFNRPHYRHHRRFYNYY